MEFYTVEESMNIWARCLGDILVVLGFAAVLVIASGILA